MKETRNKILKHNSLWDSQTQMIFHSNSMEGVDLQGMKQPMSENFIFQSPTQFQFFILNQIQTSDLYNYWMEFFLNVNLYKNI